MAAIIPKVGEIFENRYELLEVLGEGGVGIVYKARQLEADRLLALKILHPHIVEDEDWKQRFLREAQALSLVKNVHIVSVYHLGAAQNGLLYIAMELIKGKTLRRLLNEKDKLGLDLACKIARQCCAALQDMHENGITHRDLKPENIVVLDEPEPDFVKVIDFGLVHVARAAGDEKLTSTGTLVGTAKYMSPEQCRGLPVDRRSDIYSLTVCFYEMLCGHPPFDADTPIGIMYKHSNEAVPEIKPGMLLDYDRRLNKIIAKGMEKNPDLRFQSASEFAAALEELSSGRKLSGIRPFKILGSLLLVLGLSTIGFVFLGTLSKKDAASTITQGDNKSVESAEAMLGRLRAKVVYGPKDLEDLESLKSKLMSGRLRLSKISRNQLDYLIAKIYSQAGRHAEVISILTRLQGLDERSKDALVAPGRASDLDALLLESYSATGQQKQALAEVRKILRKNVLLSQNISSRCLKVLVENKKGEEARELVKRCTLVESLVALSGQCRDLHDLELGRFCLEHARALNEIRVGSDDFVIFQIELADAGMDLEENKLADAKRKLLDLYSSREYESIRKAVLEEGGGNSKSKNLESALSSSAVGLRGSLKAWCVSLQPVKFACALELVGEREKALSVLANAEPAANNGLYSLLKADLLVKMNRLEEASRVLNLLPPSTKRDEAIEMLKKIELKQVDQSTGLYDKDLVHNFPWYSSVPVSGKPYLYQR